MSKKLRNNLLEKASKRTLVDRCREEVAKKVRYRPTDRRRQYSTPVLGTCVRLRLERRKKD